MISLADLSWCEFVSPRVRESGNSRASTYGIIFHRVRRCCTHPGCAALIHSDGSTSTYQHDDRACLRGKHIPSYPLDAPAPGTWSVHS